MVHGVNIKEDGQCSHSFPLVPMMLFGAKHEWSQLTQFNVQAICAQCTGVNYNVPPCICQHCSNIHHPIS